MMNAHIMNATDSLCAGGFESYYRSLVQYFANNKRDNLSYTQFRISTNRAKSQLKCDKEAIFYTVAYAWTHYLSARRLLTQTFESIEFNAQSNSWQVIDYGCGQGIASLALLDHIAEAGYAHNTSIDLVLIEPSVISLNIAKFLCKRLAQARGIKLTVQTQACYLDEVVLPKQNACGKTLHLMSNILDIPEVQDSLEHITDSMSQIEGEHVVAATGPVYPNNTEGFNKLYNLAPEVLDCLVNKQEFFCNEEYKVTGGYWYTRDTDRQFLVLKWQN